MKIAIHPKAKDPLYVQIYDALISSIASGELVAGDILPSMRRLARDLRVNYSTVSKAYSLLEAEGYIEFNQKKAEVLNPSADAKKAFFKRWKETEALMIKEAKAKRIPMKEVARMFDSYANSLSESS